MKTIKYTWSRDAIGNLATFENGIVFRLPEKVAACGFVTFPASGKVGTVSFPVRNVGDAFHALRRGATCAADLPAHCRAW